jgi:hypothetical protein
VTGLPASSILWQAKIAKPIDSASSRWYCYYSDSSVITDPSGTRMLQWFETGPGKEDRNFGKMEGGWGYDGSGLHAKVRLLGGNYPFAGFGAGLLGGWDSAFTDLTGLTAIQFRAKGRGEWYMQVISDSVYHKYPKADSWGHLGAHIILKDHWESFVIPAEIFAPKKYSPQAEAGMTWEDVREKIIAIEFMTGQSYGQAPDDSLEIWLDDIRLIGVDKETFGL